jgi:hypothetical protein
MSLDGFGEEFNKEQSRSTPLPKKAYIIRNDKNKIRKRYEKIGIRDTGEYIRRV